MLRASLVTAEQQARIVHQLAPHSEFGGASALEISLPDLVGGRFSIDLATATHASVHVAVLALLPTDPNPIEVAFVPRTTSVIHAWASEVEFGRVVVTSVSIRGLQFMFPGQSFDLATFALAPPGLSPDRARSVADYRLADWPATNAEDPVLLQLDHLAFQRDYEAPLVLGVAVAFSSILADAATH